MAGLYKNFIDKNGCSYSGFVIITTAAGEQMSQIHNRMPVILTEKSKIELWLNESASISELKYLLNPSNKIRIEASS